MGVKQTIYHLLEEKSQASTVVDIVLISAILLNVIAFVLSTSVEIVKSYGNVLRIIEGITLGVFIIEYFSMLWAITCNPKYSKPFKGRITYALTPMALVDLFAILPAILMLGFNTSFLRVLRLFRLIRIFKLTRYTKAMKVVVNVVKSKRPELIASFMLLGVLLIGASIAAYYAERVAQPEKFGSVPAALWWAIATVTTVGYGDVYPITFWGRIVAGSAAILGIGAVALPTAILGAGFLSAFEDKNNET